MFYGNMRLHLSFNPPLRSQHFSSWAILFGDGGGKGGGGRRGGGGGRLSVFSFSDTSVFEGALDVIMFLCGGGGGRGVSLKKKKFIIADFKMKSRRRQFF